MARKKTAPRTRKGKPWVRRVAETSDAMDLPRGIFTRRPKEIARGLRQSVLRSRRTKGTGKSLAARDRRRLEAAKDELAGRLMAR